MRNFRREEFIMGTEIVFDKMNKSFLDKLDTLRDIVGFPIKLNSTYRSPEYNRSINGSRASKHMLGIAADISCKDSTKRSAITRAALNLGLTVGVASTFIHIDNRESQLMYTY